MKKILSIVIPIYNVEKYLERCLDSLLCQNISNVEIILVDDGSTDSSVAICDKYSKKYKNVFSFHKENGGLSDARNYGIKQANGEYIWFIDSDDFVEKNCISQIIDIIQKYKSDTVVCLSKTIDENNQTEDECKYTIPTKNYKNEEYMEILKKNPKSVIFCAQYHICRRELILSKQLYFYKGIIHEDELWTPQLLLNSKTIYYSNLNVYYHYMRKDSIMHSSKIEKSGKCNLLVAKELFNIFDLTGKKDLSYLRDRAANIFLQAVWKIPTELSPTKENRILPYKNAYYIKTKLKSILYYLSPNIYLKIHKLTKKL